MILNQSEGLLKFPHSQDVINSLVGGNVIKKMAGSRADLMIVVKGTGATICFIIRHPTPQKERIHLDVGNEAIRSLYQTFTGLRISTVYSFLQGSKVYFSILVYDIYTLQYKIVMCALTEV